MVASDNFSGAKPWEKTVMSDAEIALGRNLSRAEADHNLCEEQAEISFKAGRKEVVKWVECNLVYIALGYDGKPSLHLQTNEHKSAEKWQAKLKEWDIDG